MAAFRKRLWLMGVAAAGLLAVVFQLKSADTDASGPMPAEEAAKRMRVPEGFSVSLFAGEPAVMQPISLAFDTRGRLWVAEAHNYPHHVERGKDRILILEDTDGDGRADRRTVFADGLGHVTGLEVGFGGVWVMSPPEMLFIPDADGNDEPDGPPQVLLDGFGIEHSAHNIANGFTWGPDGWLYGGHGRTNPSDVGVPGALADQRVHIDGGVYRYHPVRRVFESFSDGTTNPWGVDFDEYGQAFVSNCVNPHLYHMIQGGHYEPWRNRPGSQYAYRRLPSIADHLHYTGSQLRTNLGKETELNAGGGHAHCGTMIYLGDNWPESYRGDVFMNNIHGKRVNHDSLRRHRSGYLASHTPDVMISADPWFMGVAVRYGPDGAVYVADWSDTGECHTLKPRRETGRVFRMTYGEAKWNGVDLAKLTDAELVRLHLHRNEWFVRQSRVLLQYRATQRPIDAAAVAGLRKIFEENPATPSKLRALWTLFALGQTDEGFLIQQLDHPEASVRAWAVRLLSEPFQVSPQALVRLSAMSLTDSSSFVRLHLASAMQRLPHRDRWELARGLLTWAEDETDPNLPLMIWYAVEPLVHEDLNRCIDLIQNSKISQVRQLMAQRLSEMSGS